MRIAVIGSGGQLGSALCTHFGEKAIGLTRAELDITDSAAVTHTLTQLAPDAVVNTAAYTLVDQAEVDPEACRRVNVTGVEHLAAACDQLGSVLVQISTDYVFGGDHAQRTPYREQDAPAPQGVYAWSKLHGEQGAQRAKRHFIVRTCGLYGPRPAGHKAGNFVDTMLRLSAERDRLRVVNDQHCTPTYVLDLIRAIEGLLATSAFGIFHVVNSGSTTWYAFAQEIFRQAQRSTIVEPITTEAYGARAPRPRYSVLDTSKLRSLTGCELPAWQNGLGRYLSSRQASH